MAVVLGFIYMIFVYLFAGVIVWLCIFLFFVILALLTYLCWWKWHDIENARKYNEDEGQPKDTGGAT